MTIVNFGSCCIDNVYQVPHFVAPGETLPCTQFDIHPGGKGLNQSIALAAAGATVKQAGRVGKDGRWLIDLLQARGVDTSLMVIDDGPSGHANIQVTPEGENAIVLFGGANRRIDRDQIDQTLAAADTGDVMLLQNEISNLEYVIKQAAGNSLRIAFNAAPMTEEVMALPLDAIELLIINEIEGQALTGADDPDNIVDELIACHANLNVLLTLGSAGARYANKDTRIKQTAKSVKTVDSTGAGDTFTGFFLANYSQGKDIEICLDIATQASAICVTRPGAASSIPTAEELARA